MNGDVLVLTVPLRDGLGYPSVNHAVSSAVSFGAKSEAYKALAADVEDVGRAAVAGGWETIAYPCRVSITRYAPDARVRDALNMGGCEANALTRAGVWTDDELARPITLDVQPRSAGPDRVVIVIQRLAAPVGAAARAPRPTAPKRRPRTKATPAAPAAEKSAARPRTLSELRSGDTVTMAERDDVLKELGIR